jgi:hypothetical protein
LGKNLNELYKIGNMGSLIQMKNNDKKCGSKRRGFKENAINPQQQLVASVDQALV